MLSGEENFNQYFDKSGDLDPGYTAEYARYGITGVGKGWSEVDPRFDLTTDPHEPHRFGWIVEVDPHDPKSTPRKHTMLGRLKHEGANIAIAKNGRAVAYMGDDERGDYIYKFVSAEKFDSAAQRRARRHNMKLLTKGTLYVAQSHRRRRPRTARTTAPAQWIPLCTDTKSFVPDMSVADVLIFTRLAADKVAPTKMDRPEDVEPNPVNGKVYAALTNNSNRGSASLPADEANPLAIVDGAVGARRAAHLGVRQPQRLRPGADAQRARPRLADLHLGPAAGVRRPGGGGDLLRRLSTRRRSARSAAPTTSPSTTTGNLWISTDGNVLGSNDGIFRVPVKGPERGHVQQFVTMPRGAEACGPLIADKTGRCSSRSSTRARSTARRSRRRPAPGRTPTTSRGRRSWWRTRTA